jgi:fumarylacetoacetate (FAA) hydrolase
MKLVSFLNINKEKRLGILINDLIADVELEAKNYSINLPDNMLELLNNWDKNYIKLKELENKLKNNEFIVQNNNYPLLSPLPNPVSCRDGYAFRQHVAAARRNRGVPMIEEFDQFPIFYFTNHNAIFGEGDITLELDHFEKLDFELEWAVILGKKGKNIDSKDADNYIAGFTIMNDWSARRLQMEEMLLNLGPAKGKDFATSLGPYLVTLDELEDKRIGTEFGNLFDLEMKAYHNGRLISLGNTKDMTWTFAEIIERASYGVEVFPGDVIGSGTVGTGCYLELNGTWQLEAKEKGEEFTPIWLQPNDEIILEVERLGQLKNTVKLSNNNVSILKKKKNVKN